MAAQDPPPTNLDVLMMRRFRPIAPKPPQTGQPSRSLPNPTTSLYHPGKAVTKRKYHSRVRRQTRVAPATHCLGESRANLSEHPEEEVYGESRTLTLIPDHRAEGVGEVDPSFRSLLSWSGHGGFLVKSRVEDEGSRRTPPSSCPVIPESTLPDLNDAAFTSSSSDPVRVGTSVLPCKRVLDVCLIVESVVMDESWIQVVEQLLGHSDEERLTGLAGEECPGFVSDGDNKVSWVNGAFERMMMGELACCGGRGEVGVRMAAAAGEEDLSNYPWGGFTSRVRIEYRWRDDNSPVWWGPRVVTVAPCDAWRLCSGGFAWRLDVDAALSLGLRR